MITAIEGRRRRNSANGERITIARIAEMSGTSKQVVSSILGGGASSSRFSRKTFSRVTGIARKCNYRPNRTSVNLVTGRHGSITVLFKSFYKIPFNAVNFLIRHAETYGQTVSFEIIKEDSLPRCISEDSTDGILLFEDVDEFILKALRRYKVPYVMVNTHARTQPNSITFDEEGLIRGVFKYFLDSGRKQPVLLIGDQELYWNKARLDTALSDYRGFGLQRPIILDVGKSQDPLMELEAIFADNPAADSLFIGEEFNRYAILVDRLFRSRNISIAYVFSSFSHYSFPSADFSVHQQDVPERAVELLNQIINGEKTSGPLTMPYNMNLNTK